MKIGAKFWAIISAGNLDVGVIEYLEVRDVGGIPGPQCELEY